MALEECLATAPVDRVSSFVYRTYILPALARGDSEVVVQVAEVWKALDRVYSMESIRTVLGSAKFQETYNLSSMSCDPDHGIRTKFLYRLGAPSRRP